MFFSCDTTTTQQRQQQQRQQQIPGLGRSLPLRTIVHRPRPFFAASAASDKESSSGTAQQQQQSLLRPPQPLLLPDLVPAMVRQSLCRDFLPHIATTNATTNTTTTRRRRKKDDGDRSLGLTQHKQVNPTIVLLVGVSGGCDSIALLHSLMEILEKKPDDQVSLGSWMLGCSGSSGGGSGGGGAFSLSCSSHLVQTQKQNVQQQQQQHYTVLIHAVHFDHQQRGEESDGDREFVRSLCMTHGIPLTCWFWNQDHNNRNDNNGIVFSQDAARKWRQERMEALLQDLLLSSEEDPTTTSTTTERRRRVGLILTAHHRDDSMESLVLKLLRGAHITNLRGMSSIVENQHRACRKEPMQQRSEQQASSFTTHQQGNDETVDDGKNTIWYARPFLSLQKQDLMQYLHQRGHDWREDSSNQSDKYLRNRVRNELVPLLSDLVGGKEILYRRLDHLSRQSQEVHQHLHVQSQAYLQQTPAGVGQNDTMTERTEFDLSILLATTTNENEKEREDDEAATTREDDLVRKHALNEWIRYATRGMFQISYEHLERVYRQLMKHSQKQQWRLNVGNGWDIQRNGTILRMIPTTTRTTTSLQHKDSPSTQQKQQIQWTVLNVEGDGNSDLATSPSASIEIQTKPLENDKNNNNTFATTTGPILEIAVPKHWVDETELDALEFVKTTIAEATSTANTNETSSLLFTAPWWPKERKPVRLTAFLRGQKVPLHRRQEAPIILAQRPRLPCFSLSTTATNMTLVAVFVESKQEWIIDQMFAVSTKTDDNEDDFKTLRLWLPQEEACQEHSDKR